MLFGSLCIVKSVKSANQIAGDSSYSFKWVVVFFFSAPVLVPCFFVFVAIPYSLVPYSMASSTMRLISMRAGQLLMQRPQPLQEKVPQFSG